MQAVLLKYLYWIPFFNFSWCGALPCTVLGQFGPKLVGLWRVKYICVFFYYFFLPSSKFKKNCHQMWSLLLKATLCFSYPSDRTHSWKTTSPARGTTFSEMWRCLFMCSTSRAASWRKTCTTTSRVSRPFCKTLLMLKYFALFIKWIWCRKTREMW